MLELNKIYCGDSLELMKSIPDKSIDLVVTSPPYDNLRTYEGFTFDFEGMAKELFRIMKTGGVVVWVVADATINGSETGTSFRQALYFMEVGFRLHDTMIYAKNSYMPIKQRRYQQSFEYVFILSNGEPNSFNPIQEKTKTFGTIRLRGNDKEERKNSNGWHRTQVKEKKDVGNIFVYDVGKNDTTEHSAPFPVELCKDHILSWSNPNDIVLDIFNGSGTTCLAAEMLGRKWIGIDLSRKYCDIAERRIDLYQRQGKLDL